MKKSKTAWVQHLNRWVSSRWMVWQSMEFTIQWHGKLIFWCSLIGENLHRVFPCNFFGKNLNNASRKNARQKIIKKHLVQKRVEGSSPISLSLSKRKKNKKRLESSVSILSKEILTRLNPFLRLNFLALDVWKFQTKEHHGKLWSV